MIKSLKIVLILVWVGFVFEAYTQDTNNKLILFADRNFCISGDTLWFKVWVPSELDRFGNVVHVQLETANGNLVSSVARKSSDGCAEGFISVPDSLSTGLCYLTSFLNAQRSEKKIESIGKSVYVYNRFEEYVRQMEVPNRSNYELITDGKSMAEISIDKTKFEGRDQVNGAVTQNTNEILFAVVSARVIDPFSDKHSGFLKFDLRDDTSVIPPFAEKDGILISGVVKGTDESRDTSNLVLLSITEDPPYFDYYYCGEEGNFHFFLENAEGNANIILQTVGNNESESEIRPILNHLKRMNQFRLDTLVFTTDQFNFVDNGLKNSFYSKLFNRQISADNSYFSMPNTFGLPFYGVPTLHVIPDEFFDLPDFKEISRELLSGFQYRTKNDEILFRVLNSDQKRFFEEQPLRLLNGIPVFKNSFFSELTSSDIHYIDLVQSERVFGDLKFNGVLAVALNNQSNSWLAQQPNVFQYKGACLQPEKRPAYGNRPELKTTEPDIRQNFIWEVLPANGVYNFSFYLSDVTGIVEISVEGLTKSNRIFKTSKTIEVK